MDSISWPDSRSIPTSREAAESGVGAAGGVFATAEGAGMRCGDLETSLAAGCGAAAGPCDPSSSSMPQSAG